MSRRFFYLTKGFTLIELLLVLAIIACLATLLGPTIGTVIEKTNASACLSNLRQIGISAQLYAGEHEQTMPTIEPWPSQPVYSSSDGAQPLLDAFQPYGITAAILQCRSDAVGPNYYKKEGSSYEWCPMANGQKVQAPKLGLGGGPNGITLSQLLMAFDYSGVHHESSNVLFGDGHVATTTP